MKRANPKKANKSQKHYVSDKQLEKIKRQVSKEMTEKVALIILAAASDEVNLTDEQVCNIMVRVDRYASHVDNHLVKMRDIQNAIRKNTGLELKGW